MSVHYIIQKTKTTLNTSKCTKGFSFITCNTLLHVSTLLGHLQGELSPVVTLGLHFIVELLIVYCVAFWRRELSVVSAYTAEAASDGGSAKCINILVGKPTGKEILLKTLV
jgi:hypothetical protein